MQLRDHWCRPAASAVRTHPRIDSVDRTGSEVGRTEAVRIEPVRIVRVADIDSADIDSAVRNSAAAGMDWVHQFHPAEAYYRLGCTTAADNPGTARWEWYIRELQVKTACRTGTRRTPQEAGSEILRTQVLPGNRSNNRRCCPRNSSYNAA